MVVIPTPTTIESGKFATPEQAIAYTLGKTLRPIGKSNLMGKAYVNPDGTVDTEGFISTPIEDIEKDAIEPESFAGEPLYAYMHRGAPVSMEHQTKAIPVGVLRKAVLVRDGKILQKEDNPLYPAVEFRYFDGGTGWYGLANIDEPEVSKAILKGKISSFSWIGMPRDWEERPGGGRHFHKWSSINPLLEVTVTGYPINPQATMRLAKALGYIPQYTDEELALIADVVASILVPTGIASKVIESIISRKRND